MNVAKRMKRNPVFVDEGDSMKKAMDLLKEHEIRHLPVLKDGERLVGILSERDIKQASPPRRPRSRSGRSTTFSTRSR